MTAPVPTFPAKFAGVCKECDKFISVGQEIFRLESGGYAHANPDECDGVGPTKETKFQGTTLDDMGY